ncbi:unnamed protein product [Caenorhabditis sp. 36 PRJEB53466]|nr:unnamed protein product [Caenorhabditis sp. 36 PRJEB53466]
MRSDQRKMSGSRKQSLVEAAEQHFDKNTLILIVNVVILTILISLLYMVATLLIDFLFRNRYFNENQQLHSPSSSQ